jgi:hypothetical protein
LVNRLTMRDLFAAHTVVNLTGASPVLGIDCLSR